MTATKDKVRIVKRVVTGDRESWRLRVFMTVDEETAKSLREALQTDIDGYVDTDEEWERREFARDLICDIHNLVDVRPYGAECPGQPFAWQPWIKCVGNRVMLSQLGGLDI